MIFIFALGIITLAVFHAGFRKVVFWLLGGAAAYVAIVIANMAVTGRW